MTRFGTFLLAIFAIPSRIAATTASELNSSSPSQRSPGIISVIKPTTYNMNSSVTRLPSDVLAPTQSSPKPAKSSPSAISPATNCTTTTIYVLPATRISPTGTHPSHGWNHSMNSSTSIVGTGTVNQASGSGFPLTSQMGNSTYQAPTLTASVTGSSVVVPVVPTVSTSTTRTSKSSSTATAQPSEPLFTASAERAVGLRMGVVGGAMLGVAAMVL